jgi:RND family efflux transporter MFP subunit
MPLRPRPGLRRPALAVALTAALALGASAALVLGATTALAGTAELAAVQAQPGTGASPTVHDGVVEAVRQTVIAAQVSGAVVELPVKAGDRVKAGQLLLRLDARAADQGAAASDAQVRAARAAQDVAAKEFARQQQLAAAQFISAAALDRAQAEFKAAQAQAEAQLAQAGAARTQTGFYVVRAPYAGVLSEVSVTLGEMAMPGRALVTLYDPGALRVSASVPQSAATTIGDGKAVRAEIPALAEAAQRMQTPLRVQVLPAADAATHTVTLRADLPPELNGAMPGQFARLWWPSAKDSAAASPWVPLQAIVRRAEMTGLYVLDPNGRPQLRQVRLGRNDGRNVEVLSGLSTGERVAIDAQAAARLSATSR